MSRPEFVSNEDIERWSNNIDNDPLFPKEYANSILMRELSYAGLWLCEELEKLGCPDNLIVRIQWTAGKYAFGRDIWGAHQEILENYKNNELEFEPDLDEMN